MKLVRCPSCRTVNDADLAPACSGCGRNLEGMVAPAGRVAVVQHQAVKDGSRGWVVLAVLGVFSCISLVSLVRSLSKEDFGGALLLTVVSLVLVGTILWLPMKRRISASRRDDLSKATFYTLSAVAAAFGSALLLFLTCVTFAR